jgi:multiple sugar transport system permease protein
MRGLARHRPLGRWAGRGAVGLGLLLLLAWLAGPPLWLTISAVSPDDELLARPPHWLPERPTAANLANLLAVTPPDPRVAELTGVKYFRHGIRTSALLCAGVIALSLIVAAPMAYTLARLVRERTRTWILMGLLALRMLPLTTVVIPLYVLAQRLGALNTLTGLIVVYTGLLLPFAIWLLVTYFQAVPEELEEAGLIDGCSRGQVLLRITIPLARPGVFATTAFLFISTWTDLFIGLVLTTDAEKQPLSVVVSLFASGLATDTPWGLVNAAGLIATLVPLGLGLIFRRYIVTGGLLGGAFR